MKDLYEKPFTGDAYRWWRKRAKSAPEAVEKMRLESYRREWADGDEETRQHVLTYIVMSRPPGGLLVAWESIDSQDKMLESTALVAATSFASNGYRFSDEEVARLKRVGEEGNSPTTRSLALMALELGKVPGLETWLEQVATDPSPEVRFDANMDLLQAGKEVPKEKFLKDLRGIGHASHQAGLLWPRRQKLGFSQDEEGELRELLLEEMESSRAYAREYRSDHSNASALFLFSRIRQGLPFLETDIDLLGFAARFAKDIRDKVRATRALGWFGNDRAKGWIDKLTAPEYAPEVRIEAMNLRRQGYSTRTTTGEEADASADSAV